MRLTRSVRSTISARSAIYEREVFMVVITLRVMRLTRSVRSTMMRSTIRRESAQMNIRRIVLKEILHRKIAFAAGVVSAMLAVGCLVGAVTMLRVHEQRTRAILARKEKETAARMAVLEDEMRKAMLLLGFNIVILPKDQALSDWHADDYGTKYMPEEYAERLARSNVITIQHLLPSLQQRIFWPEQKRTILLVGTRGEVPFLHKEPKKPLVQPAPPGTITLGHELARDLDLKAGDTVALLGQTFTVHQCQPPRGDKDDITAWIDLAEAQALLNQKGRINAILALECGCGWARPDMVRTEIEKILPDTQVVERSSQALARAEARTKAAEEAKASIETERQHRLRMHGELERLAAALVPVVMLVAAVWIGLLAFGNVRERRSEIGLLRAVGLRSRQILLIFLSKAALTGFLGGILGVAAGLAAGACLGLRAQSAGPELVAPVAIFDARLIALALLTAPVLAAVAGWIPAMLAARQDAAEVLREE